MSASCGIAVAKDILREALTDLSKKNAAKATLVHDALRYLYPSFDENLRNYPNIEDFLNLLEMAKKFNTEEFIASKLWSEVKLQDVIQISLKAVTDHIWSLMENRGSQARIRDFVRDYLREGDTIITFNWDLTVERSLEDYPGDPGFNYRYSRDPNVVRFTLLKPHGSVDWFEKKALRGLNCTKKVGSLDALLCYYPQFNLSETPELSYVPPVIVPPVASKQIELHFLKRVWRDVFRAVSDATTLHVIGYSLPREDQFARLVLRRALRNNIIKSDRGKKKALKILLVNPDEAVEQTFYRLVGRSVSEFYFYQTYFEDYVAGLQRSITA